MVLEHAGHPVPPRLTPLDLPFRHVVSLGSTCQTAWQIERAGFKRYSGPFDWIFSTPALISHCLNDDFATFLDRSNYVMGDARTQWSPRTYVDEFGQRIMFNHHDMTNDEHYGRIVRAVDRFRALLELPDPKLFVLMVPADFIAENGSSVLADALSRRAENFKVLILALEAPEPRQETLAEYEGTEGAVELWRFRAKSAVADGLAYADPMDNRSVSAVLRFLQDT